MELLSAQGFDVSRVLRSLNLPTDVSLAAIECAGTSVIITAPGANLMVKTDAAGSNEAGLRPETFCLLQFESPKDGRWKQRG